MAEPKTERLEFRTTETTRRLVREAAEREELTITEFAERCLRREAQRVLADQQVFTLSPEAQEAWESLTERPARGLPGVAALYDRPSPFDS